MATNNPNTGPGGPHNSGHPEDLLEAFALDALDLEEEERIQDHLDACDRCGDIVFQFQETTAELARSVDIHQPPAGLRARVMQAVSREEPPAQAAPAPQLVPSLGDRMLDSKLVRVLVPLGASVAMVVVIFAVTMNVRIGNEVDGLKRENAALQASLNSNVATMTAQISEAAAAESEVMDTVLQLQQTSYELAQPGNVSLELSPPFAGSTSQGILLVSRDGSRGVIMVAGMKPPTPSTDYQVWLMRGRDKLWVGQIRVDSRGWGTVSLQLPESIMAFEKVELTTSSASGPQTDMVLQGNLVSMHTPRLVTYALGR